MLFSFPFIISDNSEGEKVFKLFSEINPVRFYLRSDPREVVVVFRSAEEAKLAENMSSRLKFRDVPLVATAFSINDIGMIAEHAIFSSCDKTKNYLMFSLGIDITLSPDAVLPNIEVIQSAVAQLNVPAKEITVNSDNHAFVIFDSLNRVSIFLLPLTSIYLSD